MIRRRTSSRGVHFIASWEGFVGTPYNDAAGFATIGYGHLLHRSPVTPADRSHWGAITRERGLELLAADLELAEAAINRLVRPPFTAACRYDAIASFVFNVGVGAFSSSTLLERLCDLRTRRAGALELLRWTHAGGRELEGLKRRRLAELELFLHGNYAGA